MNSAVSSGTHHIFFPPRLQAACRQRYPSSLASHPVGDSASHSLLGEEPHRPPSPTHWRRTAHPRDDRRVLGAVQQPGLRRPRILPERRLQAAGAIAMADTSRLARMRPNRLGGGAPTSHRQATATSGSGATAAKSSARRRPSSLSTAADPWPPTPEAQVAS